MNLVWSLSALVQGLVGGVATLVVLAIRAAIDGRTGPSFADLWTAVAVGVAVGLASFALPKLTEWQIRRMHGGSALHMVVPSKAERLSDEDPPMASRTADRFDRFTDRARRVLTLAQDEAQRFDQNYIGTEHLLLGLIREDHGTASLVLRNLAADPARIRTAVEFIVGRGDRPVFGEIGLTAGAKRVIELAIDEARRLDHRHIGTEHLLIGLIRETDGIAAGVLESMGVSLDRARDEVARVAARGEDAG
jgi:ClpA/ClpB-like protein